MVFPCCYAKQLVFLKNTFQPTEINMSSFWKWLQSLQSLLFLGSFPAKSIVKFPIAYVKYSPWKSAWGRQVIPKTLGVLFGDLDCTSTLCLLLWLSPLLVTWWRRSELHLKVCKCKAGCAAAFWVSHFSPWKMSVDADCFFLLPVCAFFPLSISPLTIVAPPKWTVSFQNMKQLSPYPEDSPSPSTPITVLSVLPARLVRPGCYTSPPSTLPLWMHNGWTLPVLSHLLSCMASSVFGVPLFAFYSE